MCKILGLTLLLAAVNACNTEIEHEHPCLFDPHKPFVTIKSRGQLGSQLFQAATGISYAIDNNLRYIQQPHKKYLYPDFLKQFYGTPKQKPSAYYSRRLNNRDLTVIFEKIPEGENIELNGGFACYKYFSHNDDTIKQALSVPQHIKKHVRCKFQHVLNSPQKKVGLHIRTFYRDIKTLNTPWACHKIFPLPNVHYIREAMNQFDPNSIFVVCSDHIAWSKKLMSTFEKQFFFLENTSLIEDFVMMTMCDHNIISSSTFSWWAAYLNPSKRKKVVAPIPFRLDKARNFDELYPDQWIRIPRKENNSIPDFSGKRLFKKGRDSN